MAYGMLEAQLALNVFLAGDRLTIADCAAATGLFYALAIHAWDEGTHPRANAVLTRARGAAVLRQGDRRRTALPASVPLALAGRLRPLPLALATGALPTPDSPACAGERDEHRGRRILRLVVSHPGSPDLLSSRDLKRKLWA
jgi:hypothetical protein